ncbi:MAG: Txe/YoeB family addiction module toxin [Holophagales bacterium]|jgi:toxin YoeB|nr:Txe/YoeB family addiction module toxin [Holophagales bacterium]
MRKTWEDEAWSQYINWQKQDRKTLDQINKILKDIERNPFSLEGIGHPEILKHGELAGWWSRHIDKANRIIYMPTKESIIILSCKGHYK